jgi:NAD(P)H-dependent FMN reductase
MTTSSSLPQIAVIVGSNRSDSLNRKLAEALAKLAAGKFEPKFVRIDDLPMFNQDHEGNQGRAREGRRRPDRDPGT